MKKLKVSFRYKDADTFEDYSKKIIETIEDKFDDLKIEFDELNTKLNSYSDEDEELMNKINFDPKVGKKFLEEAKDISESLDSLIWDVYRLHQNILEQEEKM